MRPCSRPFTGAWIETSNALIRACTSVVAPSRGRGLKRPVSVFPALRQSRPFTGAWIETCPEDCSLAKFSVAPSRGRGLKQLRALILKDQQASPLHGGVD